MKYTFLLLMALLPAATPKKDEYKDRLKAQYDRKYFLVLRDGLAVGACEHWSRYSSSASHGLPKLIVRISGDTVEFQSPNEYSVLFQDCETVAPMPIRKGQLLVVKGVRFERPELSLTVETVWLHGDASKSREEERDRGAAELRFKLTDPENFDSAIRQVGTWLKVCSSLSEADDYKHAGIDPHD